MADRITTIEQLEALYGLPGETSTVKEVDRITPHYRAFIEASPFAVLATSGPEGLDCSPRGDKPGFVRIHDEKHPAAAGPARQQPGRFACAMSCAIRMWRCSFSFRAPARPCA